MTNYDLFRRLQLRKRWKMLRQKHICKLVGIFLLLTLVSLSSANLAGSKPHGTEKPIWFSYTMYAWTDPNVPGGVGLLHEESVVVWWSQAHWTATDLEVTVEVKNDKFIFFRSHVNIVDIDEDGTPEGTYIHEQLIVWDLAEMQNPYNGMKSLFGTFRWHSGTGIFEDFKAFGYLKAQRFPFPPWDGLTGLPEGKPPEWYTGGIGIQWYVGMLRGAPEPPMIA